MTFAHKPFISIFLLLAGGAEVAAQGWHGIVPGRSTRADVVRLLHQCANPQEACDFSLAQEDIYMLFSGALPDDYRLCRQSLPLDTVMFIQITSPAVRKLSNLRFNKKLLQKFKPEYPYKNGYKIYQDEKKGLVIGVQGKITRQVTYIADTGNKALCPGYFANAGVFAEPFLQHMPVLVVSCDSLSTIAGNQFRCSATTNVNSRRGFKWTVTVGKIIAGQNTGTIIVDTTGLAAQTITASAEIADNYAGAVRASSEVRILRR